MFYFYTFIYSKVILNLSFLLLLNINAILKDVENQTVAGPQSSHTVKVNVDQQLFGFPHSSKYILTSNWCECMWCCTVYWYGGARTATDRMCAVARYNDISSKTNCGDIFIRAAAGQMCPKQDFIVVPPPSNIMEVKNKTPNIGELWIELW